jgi:Cu(I)/Ag(I) efflux system periplasmic protein CusF
MTFMTFRLLALLTLGLVAIGCGDRTDNGDADLARDAADTATFETKTYESHGVVTKIDLERGRVTLDHEKIGEWMEPMTMPFKVSDPAMLEGLEVGKRYAFTVEVTGERKYRITSLKPAQ